jgi:GNAT superfamily N-acetyltransferase
VTGARTDGVRRLDDPAALLRLAGDDVYVRSTFDPGEVGECWAGPGTAVGWRVPSRRFGGSGHLIATGDPADAAALAGQLLAGPVPLGSLSLPRDADRLVRPALQLAPRNDWEWLYADTAPPVRAHEDAVGWLGTDDADEILDLLTTWSGRHDAVPGDEHVVAWAGVRAADGTLAAVGAHLEYRAGVPFLASIATAGDHRGRGYGAAVTAWITRRALESGHELVALGMYSDNDVARQMYLRLGFRVDKRWTSGRLVRPG